MTSPDRPFELFLDSLPKATNESQKRQAFVVLAARGFSDEGFATEMALGAEYQLRFKSSGLLKRGIADAFFGNLVVEFEFDLSKTYEHALDQLRAYVAGAWNEDGSATRPYLAVATDGSRWEVFSPALIDAAVGAAAENVSLGSPIETWNPTGHEDAESLRDFLNRLLFRKTSIPPTADNFARDFGLASPAFRHASERLTAKLGELSADPQLLVLEKAWKDSLQLAYGSVETDSELFAKHTYLAALARLLVWTALERRAISVTEIKDVLSGIYFQGRNISNLVETDFFGWYQIPSETSADPIWVGLSRHLAGYDFRSIKEDILKPLYEQLVDPLTRKELGEFYTPDWLASKIVAHLFEGYDWASGPPRVLDPACGSGTFLRTAIDAFKSRPAARGHAALLEAILAGVMGIDVHPLAVIIARATYLLAIKDLIDASRSSITLPVFLANSLKTPPVEIQKKFEESGIELIVDGKKYTVPADLVYHGADYDYAIDQVLEVAQAYGAKDTKLEEIEASLSARVADTLQKYDSEGELTQTLGAIARHLANLIRERRDSVHGFMLKNHYRPAMLRGQFDLVIGNPPWLTVASIATPEYKDLVIRLATVSKIAPRSAGEQSHTELATLFLSIAVGSFLSVREDSRSRIALVMPRSLMTGKHHRNLREGSYSQRFDVTEIWDLDNVSPLFNIPTCVIFVAAQTAPRPQSAKRGKILSGRLPKKDVPLHEADALIEEKEMSFTLSFLGKRSAWVPTGGGHGKSLATKSQNAYLRAFRQGAILYPQTLLTVKVQGGARGKTVRVVTDESAIETAKVGKDAKVNHIVDTANLYATAAADHLLPYALLPPLWTVVLPTLGKVGTPGFRVVDADELRLRGHVKTAAWLEWAEGIWESVRKKGDATRLSARLDNFGHLSSNAGQRRFLVLFTAAGNRPVSAVIDTQSQALPFVARDRTYWASFDSSAESHFMSAFLNSDFAADVIVDWMNRGLFGPRDINKRILDVPWPRFDSRSADHVSLSDAGKTLANAARGLLTAAPPTSIGRMRSWLRGALDKGDLLSANRLVARISKSVGKA